MRSGPAERVLVVETEGALPPPRRRRRRPRKAVERDAPLTVTVSVVTVILAEDPLAGESAADQWLAATGDSDHTGRLVDDAVATLDRVLSADSAASGTSFGSRTRIDSILAARIGYGEGDQVASGRFLDAVDVDARGGTGSRRRERAARTGSISRTAAILAGREPTAACEVLIPRVRLDLESGNEAAACLVAAGAVAATINELEFAVEDEAHERDLDQLEELLAGLNEISTRAESGDTPEGDLAKVGEALDIAERVIRRRRILDQ